ncbi:UDP-galactopyranose mutase [Flavobacterium oreochromis]|uniref:UDP-galactopyranose mutase n=1 Tax=Flavobacterium oreochromis TaxID=2906078 RepID=A0ABW8P8U5_9FLAO|nr:UDP-galactopyranose mutase [Flavobacterium oreochromis]OWP76180.1 UDP-galactopyranose mutase [Flavobacterium oreochromis]POR18961.1 UDP-galactopyranose mutase [Flavobacterium columnare]
MKYDLLIIGSGLFGAVFAHEAKKNGKKCLVIDKRNHKGGNIYCEKIEDINVHKYGAHIFHTNDEEIWNYVNQFGKFNNYINSPISISRDKIYNLPFNMNTFYQLWGLKTPIEVKKKIQEQIAEFGKNNPKNLEEQAISLVGLDVYQTLIKEYTEKQWGRKATDLPAFIIKRLPIRFTYDNNYFNDKFQGIPEGGYNKIIESLLDGIDTKLETDFFSNREYFESIADNIVYTGKIDEFYDYKFGKLEYRSLRFENTILDTDNFQGNAVVNYNDIKIPYTRIIEHKHFEFGKQNKTVITKEYPQSWDSNKEAYYPINDQKNQVLYEKYKSLTLDSKNVIFGGRLAEYKYYDMHQIIASALTKFKKYSQNEI